MQQLKYAVKLEMHEGIFDGLVLQIDKAGESVDNRLAVPSSIEFGFQGAGEIHSMDARLDPPCSRWRYLLTGEGIEFDADGNDVHPDKPLIYRLSKSEKLDSQILHIDRMVKESPERC